MFIRIDNKIINSDNIEMVDICRTPHDAWAEKFGKKPYSLVFLMKSGKVLTIGCESQEIQNAAVKGLELFLGVKEV